jgi:hypothetical protein
MLGKIKGVAIMNIIRVLVVLSVGLFFACGSNLDSSNLPLNKQFVMADNLMCNVKDSSDKKEIGKKINLMGLTTTQPKAKFESGVTSPLQKVFESESTLTVLLIASDTGSVDAFVIDKKNGHFSRASAGSCAGVYSLASIGICQ